MARWHFAGAVRRWSSLVLLAIAVICPGPRAWSNDAPIAAESAFTHIPAGIADVAGITAYIANAEGGIDAIDMANGKARWRSTEAVTPIAMDATQLVARCKQGSNKANTFTVVVLDKASGNVLLRPQPIELPDWIACEGGIGLSFASVAAIDGNDLLIHWQAAREFAGQIVVTPGTPKPTPEMLAAAKKNGSGVARMDLSTGQSVVNEDAMPKSVNVPRRLKFYDVAGKRLTMEESSQVVAGGIRIIDRTLQAIDQQTGRLLWRVAIAGDVLVPVNQTPAAGIKQPGVRGPTNTATRPGVPQRRPVPVPR